MIALVEDDRPRLQPEYRTRWVWRTRGPRKRRARAWDFCLYVAGRTAHAEQALANLRRLCTEHLPGGCKIEVVDLHLEPHRALADQIVAVPTVVRRSPGPIKRMVGTMTDLNRVREFLGIEVPAAAMVVEPVGNLPSRFA